MKQFFLTVLGVFLGLILFVVVVPTILITAAVSSASSAPVTASNTVLELDLRDGLSDQDPINPFAAFGLKDSTAAEDRARQLAVRGLQAKAALYAQALGVPLAGIRSLTESGGYSPRAPSPMYARAEMSMDVGSTPVAAGELTVRIDITGVYDLGR